MNLSLLIRAIFGLAFFQGILSYIGIPSFQHQLLLEFLIVILLFTFFYFLSSRVDQSFKTPGLIWFFLYTIAVLTSALVNNSDLYTSIRFYRHVLWPYLFFLSIMNIDLSPQSIRKINKFVVFLVILQIPAALYKYLMYGVRESILIGTFDTQEGSMSAIFPLFIIGYLVAFYLIYKKNIMYLLLIPGFMFFAWGGGKRAFFILFPILILLTYFIYNKAIKYKTNIFPLIIPIVFALIVLYIGGRYHPRFNPEEEYGGSFDISYIITQIAEYETRYSYTHGGTSGRLATTLNVFEQVINWNTLNIIFGDGPDRLYLAEDQRFFYDINYGLTGLNYNLISIGILGTFSLFLLYLNLGAKTYYYIKNSHDSFYKAIAFGTVLVTIIFCFDFLLYSRAFFTQYIPSILFFYITAIILKQNNNSNEIKKQN